MGGKRFLSEGVVLQKRGIVHAVDCTLGDQERH